MAEKLLNRTVEDINPLLDKIDNNYSRQEIDSLISAVNEKISALSERVGVLENKGGENS